MLRALFDTNLFINVLLSPDPFRSAVGASLREAALGRFQLVLVPEAAIELLDVVRRRPHLASRITPGQALRLIEQARSIATTVPALRGEIPAVSRPHGRLPDRPRRWRAGSDAIVTRDHDLLDLVAVNDVRILHPATLLDMLRADPGSEAAG